MKTRLASMALLGFLIASPLYPTFAGDNPYPGELGGLAAQAEQNHQPVVILSTPAAVQAFSSAVVSLVGDDKAKVPDNTVYIITPDALGMPGAGENEHATDPWPVVAFDKYGVKTGSGLFLRGVIERALKQVQGLPT